MLDFDAPVNDAARVRSATDHPGAFRDFRIGDSEAVARSPRERARVNVDALRTLLAVEMALLQVGNVGGAPYWSWYGFPSRVEWCACFISWCANECGYIEAGAVSKFSYCPSGVQWFRDAGLWLPGGSEPAAGDIAFFDWNGDGTSDHVGIAESCDGSTVRTVEGNSSDSCRQRSYSMSSGSIMGYGTPMY